MSPNRLASETSPYLLQHADNPVDWHPWGAAAFDEARSRDVPILLSVGYSACHWCHVMAHESFEDPETAAFMNAHFVNVKVDREERPDVDGIYMEAVQALTGSGGWPMTVFLTPDAVPFYAGTYFPKQDRHGMPSFRRVLAALTDAWSADREDLVERAGHLGDALRAAAASGDGRPDLSEEVLRRAWRGLRDAFDRANGGFGGAPKFPQPMTLEFALRMRQRGWDDADEIVATSLDRLACGGIHDQIGGGFHRYATDAIWLVPHFEKMLYDNAQLARLYLHAWQVTRDPTHERVARSTLDYLLREMQHPDGGFYSSQDADSEGEEGRFFVWTWDELVSTVGEEQGRLLGATPPGNWEGVNVLWQPEAPVDEATRAALLAHREWRVRPGTDDKILAAWNGLAISAFAEAGRVLSEPRYTRAAEHAADFALTALRRPDGRLLRSWRDGRAEVLAFLDDYALLADGLLTLHGTTGEQRWGLEARHMADETLRLFRPDDGGAFFQTGSDAEPLLARPRRVFDDAEPSGNSVAAALLQRMALLTRDATYERAAVDALLAVAESAERFPTGFGQALSAIDLWLSPTRELAIVGERGGAGTEALLDEAWVRYLPSIVVGAGAPGDVPVFELLEGRTPEGGRAVAYLCERFACRLPAFEPTDLAVLLEGR